MSEEEKQETDTPEENQSEEQTSESSEESQDSEDIEALKKQLNSAVKQKEHFRKKFDEVKSALNEEKQEAETPQEKSEVEDKVNFLLENQGKNYSKEDIELISKKAKLDSLSMSKAAEDEDIQSIIENRHQKKKQDEESIEPSSPTMPQPDKPISEMTSSEFRKYEERVNQAQKGV